MIDWLTGCHVGWTRKTSFSRTLSRILTKMFSFANWKTSALPRLHAEIARDLARQLRVGVAVVDLELVRVQGRRLPLAEDRHAAATVRAGLTGAARRRGAIVAHAVAVRKSGPEGGDRRRRGRPPRGASR